MQVEYDDNDLDEELSKVLGDADADDHDNEEAEDEILDENDAEVEAASQNR